MRILIVEDDDMIGASIRNWLVRESYTVDWLTDGLAANASLRATTYDLLILDLGLPGKDGTNLLKEIRRNNNPVVVLVVTARDSMVDKIDTLDMGADDYLIKPFNLNELSARVRALARRRCGSGKPQIEIGDLCLNPVNHDVSLKGKRVHVTLREFSLLRILMEHPSKPFSREELQDRLYNWDETVNSNVIEHYISSLRRKLGSDWIHNMRGVGWMLCKSA